MSADTPVDFEGHEPRQCGEHRTLGSHRAWCHQCGEYCYPRFEAACHGCRAPLVDAIVEAAREWATVAADRRGVSPEAERLLLAVDTYEHR